MANWHTLGRRELVEQLETSEGGLTAAQVQERLQRYGPNQLESRGVRSPLLVFAEQFTDIMVIVLMVAAVLSFIVGDAKDGIMILIIVLLNAILGFSQEYRAERAMAALKKLSVATVRVKRGDQVTAVAADQLVPGDVVLLEAGARVPADARVLESINLRVEEAALTGESVPVDKSVEALPEENLPIGDRRNMVFMGTAVAAGRGAAVVVETGMRTELGNIANMLQTVTEEKTPLQKRTAELGKWLALGALAICAVVFALCIWRGEAASEMFLTAISLAVAAVPEGLPAVVTIALALGAQRMVKRNALIRKLPAVETLGSVTTICSDKTGTLTENRMTVTMLDVAGETLDVMAQLETTGALLPRSERKIAGGSPEIGLLLLGGALCNDAVLEAVEDDSQRFRALGDPTEGALVVVAARMGLWKDALEKRMPRVAEAPFTSERKRMTTVHALPSEGANEDLPFSLPSATLLGFTKGSVDGLVGLCDHVLHRGQVEPMTDEWRTRIRGGNDALAGNGMRVLGVAMRPMSELSGPVTEESLEQHLTFVGMTGMIDPPRREVREAVNECRAAGIRPVMITGDHPLTALNVARELGIARADASLERVITGQQLAEMSVEELEAVVEDIPVYARVSPEHKVKIVEALKRRGHFVSMTGDGVNDAPALKRADIGVAMGITGTDVSKEAADMVLLDDNFATIVHAIEEGRTIYENIRRFIRYIVSCNVGEILIMLAAPLLGLPIPLTAVQLLWTNLVTDGLPALALGLEPAAPDTMQRPPNPPDESVLARGLGRYVLLVGILLGAVSLATEFITKDLDHAVWQTMVFTTLGLSQMGNALAVRSDRESVFKLGLLTNKPLLGAIALTVVLQMIVVYVPFMQNIFGTTALNVQQLLTTLGLSAVVFIVVEVAKWIGRLRTRTA
ncbi:MAG: cation-translocating P-type ATPase [Chloroflexi bacterium]|nr:cation-translocating P-type ATPase [Chloroflexota bacterium]